MRLNSNGSIKIRKVVGEKQSKRAIKDGAISNENIRIWKSVGEKQSKRVRKASVTSDRKAEN